MRKMRNNTADGASIHNALYIDVLYSAKVKAPTAKMRAEALDWSE